MRSRRPGRPARPPRPARSGAAAPSTLVDPPVPPGLVVTPLDLGAEKLVVFSFEPAQSGARELTPTEMAIVGLLIQGRSNAEIARVRGRSANTVANQVAAIFRKLRVSSRLELARRF